MKKKEKEKICSLYCPKECEDELTTKFDKEEEEELTIQFEENDDENEDEFQKNIESEKSSKSRYSRNVENDSIMSEGRLNMLSTRNVFYINGEENIFIHFCF
jgi:hypothetical protein